MLYRIDISPRKFWFLIVPGFFVVFGFVLLLSYIIVDKAVMPKIIGAKNKWDVTIPNLVGLSADSAKSVCIANGVKLSENRSEYNDSVPTNTIISQEPESGSTAKQGRHVVVVLSKGTEIAAIPTIFKLQEGPAKRALRNAGFNNIAVITQYNTTIKKDCSIGTDPAEGSITSREARVTLLLSKGERPSKAEVPDLTGMKLSEAKNALEQIGLKVGTLTYESSPEAPAGIVINQSAEPGSSIPFESSVTLVISIE